MSDNDPIAEAIADGLLPASEYHGKPGQDASVRTQRVARMIRMKNAGMTWQQIAEAEGYTDKSSARHLVINALRDDVSEQTAILREIENQRLDTAQAAIWPLIVGPRAIPHPETGEVPATAVDDTVKLRAVTTFTRLSARRAAMNGLNAPQRVAISTDAQVALEAAMTEFRETVLGEVISITDEAPDDDRRLEA